MHLVASPLERAQRDRAAARRGPRPRARSSTSGSSSRPTCSRAISFGDGGDDLRQAPGALAPHVQPVPPSWGEPYDDIAARMMAAVHDARDAARGHEAVVVSHQLPIWTHPAARRGQVLPPPPAEAAVHAVLAHHRCTSTATACAGSTYSEPAGDLIPVPRPAGPVLGRRRRRGGAALIVTSHPRAAPASSSPCSPAPARHGLTGCTSLEGAGDKGYVTGDGQVDPVAAADRGEPIELEGEDLDGEPLSLADFRGKPSWSSTSGAPGAPPAAPRRPTLVEAAEELEGDGAEFVGHRHPRLVAGQRAAFVRDFDVPYPLVLLARRQGAAALPRHADAPTPCPRTVVLDAEGRVAACIIGELPSTADAGRRSSPTTSPPRTRS